jgi:hypothetical protein
VARGVKFKSSVSRFAVGAETRASGSRATVRRAAKSFGDGVAKVMLIQAGHALAAEGVGVVLRALGSLRLLSILKIHSVCYPRPCRL